MKGKKTKEGKLTNRQLAFCREYCKDFNGTQAAILAGYAEKHADITASKYLRFSKVQAEIKRLLDPKIKKDGITIERNLHETSLIAYAPLIQKGIIKPFDKLKAIEILNKMLDFNESDKEDRKAVTGFNLIIKREK
jgi:phage terminase small subunit